VTAFCTHCLSDCHSEVAGLCSVGLDKDSFHKSHTAGKKVEPSMSLNLKGTAAHRLELMESRLCTHWHEFLVHRTETQHKFEQVFKTLYGAKRDPEASATAQLARRLDECEACVAEQVVEVTRSNSVIDRMRQSFASEATKAARSAEELFGRCAALDDGATQTRLMLDDRAEELARSHRKGVSEFRQVLDARIDEVSRSHRKASSELRQMADGRSDELDRRHQQLSADVHETLQAHLHRHLLKLGHGRIQSVVARIVGNIDDLSWKLCFQSWRDLVDVRLRAKSACAMEEANGGRDRCHQELSAAVELLRKDTHSRTEEVASRHQEARADIVQMRQEVQAKAEATSRSHRELTDQLAAHESRRELDLHSVRKESSTLEEGFRARVAGIQSDVQDTRADTDRFKASLLSEVRACQAETLVATESAKASNLRMDQISSRLSDLHATVGVQKSAEERVLSARLAETLDLDEVTRHLHDLRDAQVTLGDATAASQDEVQELAERFTQLEGRAVRLEQCASDSKDFCGVGLERVAAEVRELRCGGTAQSRELRRELGDLRGALGEIRHELSITDHAFRIAGGPGTPGGPGGHLGVPGLSRDDRSRMGRGEQHCLEEEQLLEPEHSPPSISVTATAMASTEAGARGSPERLLRADQGAQGLALAPRALSQKRGGCRAGSPPRHGRGDPLLREPSHEV